MNNESHIPDSASESTIGAKDTELKPVFRIRRTEVWDLAPAALYQASPDGGKTTNYA